MVLNNLKSFSNIRLNTKTAVVTGANTGIGKMTVKEFYKRGARVIMACRNLDKANQAAKAIKVLCSNEKNVGELIVADLDLSNLQSIRKCAKRLSNEKQINILINNAGVMMCPKSKTIDGFETQFGTNHLGHFLFTLLLLPKIINSSPSRIINVSSKGHTFGRINFDDLNCEHTKYNPFQAYAQSKLANILFTKELARRLQEKRIDNVSTYSVHPGVVSTELGRHLNRRLSKVLRVLLRPIVKSSEDGAQTTVYCAISTETGKDTGLYYHNCKVAKPSDVAQNMEEARRLWEVSEKLVQLDNNYDPFSSNGLQS